MKIEASIKFAPGQFRGLNDLSISNSTWPVSVKKTTMKTTNLLMAAVVSASLAFGVAAQAKEHEEQNISSSDVPAAVQKAADAQTKGGKIVRWEKEGANYEAVIDKNGSEWGVKIDANGKVLSKHNESKEKGEKY
jgi:uncharacterized membrane protein YkoI